MSSPADPVPGAITVAADLKQVRDLAAWLRERCVAEGIVDMIAFELELALVEAANNCVEHGYAPGEEGRIGLDFTVGGGEARVLLYDRGRPLPENALGSPGDVPCTATSGRGIGIVIACTNGVEYRSENGLNRLTMRKLLF